MDDILSQGGDREPSPWPRRLTMLGATDRGLLLAPLSPRPGSVAYKLWNPAAPQASRTFGEVIAASPAEIAWTPPAPRSAQAGVPSRSR